VGLEDAGHLGEDVGVLGRFRQVLGPGEADGGELPQGVDDAEDVLPGGREPGADRRTAEVHDPQALLALVDAPAVAVEGFGVGAHLASQRGEDAVLHLGAPDLYDVGELPLLGLEGLLQGDDLVLEIVQQPDGRESQRRRVGVVGALVEVEVVGRGHALVHAVGLGEDLEGAVGEHLVHVHVGARARAPLEQVDDDVLVEAPVRHLAAGALDRVRLRLVVRPGAEDAIGARAGELDHAEGVDQLGVRRAAGQGEVLQGALGVDAVQRRRRDRHLADEVALQTMSGLRHETASPLWRPRRRPSVSRLLSAISVRTPWSGLRRRRWS